MTPESVKANYARMLPETVIIRRHTGLGTTPPYFEATARAKIASETMPEVGDGIIQEKYKIIIFADDLIAAQMALPLTTDDTVWIRGKELSIVMLNDSNRRMNGILIAYEIEAVG